MHGILVGAPLFVAVSHPIDQNSRDQYSDKLGQWKGSDPFRSSIADDIMRSGGASASMVELDHAELIVLPPPMPVTLCILVLGFHTANTSRIHDTMSKAIDNSFDAISQRKNEPKASLDIHTNFHGFLDRNEIADLFYNLFRSLSEHRQNRLRLYSPETGSSPFVPARHSAQGAAEAASLATFRSESAARVNAQYRAEGGLKASIDAQAPDEVQSKAIKKAMQDNLAKLTHKDGLKVENRTFSLDETGGDFISGDEFNPNDQTEWCLLRTGNNYSFITAQSADDLIKNGNKHPLTNKAMQNGDIIRGKAILDLMTDKPTTQPAAAAGTSAQPVVPPPSAPTAAQVYPEPSAPTAEQTT